MTTSYADQRRLDDADAHEIAERFGGRTRAGERDET